MVKLIGVNERGYRVGQWHQRAKFSDAVIEQVRQMHDDGITYAVIAQKIGMSIFMVGRVCRHEKRAEAPVRFKRVES